MNKIDKIILTFTLIFSVGGTVFAADNGQSSFPIALVDSFGARGLSLGDTAVALRGDLNSLPVNPAGVASMEKLAFSVSRLNWLFDSSFNAFNLVWPLPPERDTRQYRYGVLGLSAELFTLDGYSAVWDGQSLDTPGSADFAVGLTYAFNLFKPFDVVLGEKVHLDWGLTVKYFQSRLAEYVARDLAFDVGLCYSYAVPNLSRLVKSEKDKKQPANQDTFTAGLSFRNLAVNLTPYYNGGQILTPWVLDFGLSYVVIGTERHRALAAVSLKKPSDSDLFVQTGLEYAYKNTIFLRGGYKILGRENDGFSFGVGLNFELTDWLAFQADYSVIDQGTFGMLDVFSLTVIF